MSEDLKIELAKQQYIESINEISKKYCLSLTIIEIILSGLLDEVHEMKITKIKQEQEKLEQEKIEKESEK